MAAAEKFRIELSALVSSAAHVNAHGEDLANAHWSSDNRIATVQASWVGASAAALSIKTAAWLETSRTLLTRLGEHALDLNNDAIEFAERERQNAEKLKAQGA